MAASRSTERPPPFAAIKGTTRPYKKREIRLARSNLEFVNRLAPREAARERVPKSYVLLPPAPAEEHDLLPAPGVEVDEPRGRVLHLDALAVDPAKRLLDVRLLVGKLCAKALVVRALRALGRE